MRRQQRQKLDIYAKLKAIYFLYQDDVIKIFSLYDNDQMTVAHKRSRIQLCQHSFDFSTSQINVMSRLEAKNKYAKLLSEGWLKVGSERELSNMLNTKVAS